MKILTFDTSLDKMFITLGNDDKADEYRVVENTKERYHSALLIPTIIELLQKQSLTMQDLDAIGVNIGPGSFTGIRASATVARTLGQNLNIPIVGIPSLEILSLINTSEKEGICVLDARKGQAYVGVYSPLGDIIENPHTLEYEKLVQKVKNGNYTVIADLKMSKMLLAEEITSIIIEENNSNSGINLAKLTYKHLNQDAIKLYSWFNLKPLYIQPPPISMPKILS